ncbi:hypothetical protein [Streptomyces sp. NPDC057382]|uniref:hypothetical protein n=1 Tax=unclassified Streptomyces TaxID=2593676 RepID=UPI00363EDC62
MNFSLLYSRSRALPSIATALVGIAALAALFAHLLQQQLDADHTSRLPVTVFAPLLAAAAIGTSLHTPSDELDRTAVRRWATRRLLHVGVLTGLTAALLAGSVPGGPHAYGAGAMVRNLVGVTGVTVAASVLLGARRSWLPVTLYVGLTYLLAPPGPHGTVWTWYTQPGSDSGSWAVAATAFVTGTVLHSWRGSRAEG